MKDLLELAALAFGAYAMSKAADAASSGTGPVVVAAPEPAAVREPTALEILQQDVSFRKMSEQVH